MVRTNQGGSVLNFVIIGAVLVGLLVSGTYVVRHYILKGSTPQAVVNQPVQAPSESPKPNEVSEPPQEASRQQSHASSAPATPHQSPAALPQSGPSGVGSLIPIALLAVVAVSYVQSRHPKRSL